MAHVKVWLSLVCTLVLSALLWMIPPQLQSKLQSYQPQLAPLAQNRLFQQKLSDFFKKNQGTLQQLAGHKGLLAALSELSSKLPDRKWKRHQQAHQAVRGSFPFFRGPQQNKRVYVFSTAPHLLFRSDKPEVFSETPGEFDSLPVVQRALAGKFQMGFWRIGQQPFFLLSHPIQEGQKVVGALVMTMNVDREFLVELGIHPESQQTHPILLLDREKPLAFGVPKKMMSAVRGWLSQNYVSLSQQLELGTMIPTKAVSLQDQQFSYILARFPSEVSDLPIGYLLFAKLPTIAPTKVEQGKYVQEIAVGAGLLSLLLVLWFSFGLYWGKRKLFQSIEQISHAPEQAQLVDTIPSGYKSLRAPLRVLSQKFAARAVAPPAEVAVKKALAPAAKAPAPMPVAAPAPAQPPRASIPLHPSLLDPAYAPAEATSSAPPNPGLPSLPPLSPNLPPAPGPALPPLSPLPSPPVTPAPAASLAPVTPAPAEPVTPFRPPPAESLASSVASAAPAKPAASAVEPASASPISAPASGHTPVPASSRDLADELEQAFTSIQDGEAPASMTSLNSVSSSESRTVTNPPGTAEAGLNRQTLLYEQFDADNLAAATEAIQQEKLQRVFKEYLSLREKCGESTENIPFSQFVERLDKQRDAIMKQLNCADVQFQVYEKAGRAAIKATPIK